MEFSLVVNISIVIGFLSFSALCIYFIVFLSRLRESLSNVQKDIQEVSRNTVPVLDNLTVITDKVRAISENVDDQISIVRSSVESLREMTDNIVAFEANLQSKVEGPLMETLSFVTAIVRAFQAFFNKLRS